MFSSMLELWRTETIAFLETSSVDNANIAAITTSLVRSHLALKILRKQTIYGFKQPHEQPDVNIFIEAVFDRIKVMLDFRKKYDNVEQIKALSEKYLILLTKVLLDLHEHYPYSFIGFIKPSLELIVFYIFTSAGDGLLFERFIVQCLNLVKALLTCPEYKPCRGANSDKDNPNVLKAVAMKTEFFTESVLVGICHKLITHFFLLTQEDLEIWDMNPEEFCMELEGGESWKYSLRPCTENLFIALYHEYKEHLNNVVMKMCDLSRNPVDPSDYHGILQKDAIYNAIGLAAFELFDEIDFDSWFSNILIGELKIKASNYRIIRRRVITLIGQWTGVKFSHKNRPKLYELCIDLLSPEEDFVVRLSAALTLKSSVDDFEFEPEQFMPYLPTIFGLLFNLLKEAHECDTKMQVLHVMSFMVEVVGVGIQPHAAPLVQYLPALWEESAEHNMLRCAILNTLIHMVAALMKESENLHEFLIKIIRISTDVRESCHVYLLEDGLELWLAVLENTVNPSKPLLDLYHNMLPLLELSTENLRFCIQITNAYILLCPREFLLEYGSSLVQQYLSMINDLKSEGLTLLLRSIEMMIRTLPNDAPTLAQPLLVTIVQGVTKSKHYPMVLSMFLSIIARLVLHSYENFMWSINRVGEIENTSSEIVLDELLESWTNQLVYISPEERRKLCSLALAQLCSSSWPAVLKIWSSAITSISSVIFDLSVDDTNEDKLVMVNGDLNRTEVESPVLFELETEHVKRRQILVQSDPVHTTSLRSFLGQQLKAFEQSVDPQTLASLYENLEVDCKKLLQQIMSSTS